MKAENQSPDTRISREFAKRLSQEELYLALIEPVWQDVSRGTHGQFIMATATFFIREVDNGGLSQAFHNLTLKNVNSALEAFEELGASRHVSCIRSALEKMFNGGFPPSDEDLHSTEDSLTLEWIEEHFNELDEQLYDERQLWPYFERYVADHP